MKKPANTNVLFIEARKKGSFFDSELRMFTGNAADALETLPKSFSIAYTIQYKYIAERLKLFFEKNGKKVYEIMQVVGCSALKTKEKNVLLIGSGRFHALQLAVQGKNLYVYENAGIIRLNRQDIDRLLLNKKVALSKFFSAESVGIITSSKAGQNNLAVALSLKKRIEKLGKKPFLFISGTISTRELENFNIDFWVNTACPGIAVYDDSKNVLNYTDLKLQNSTSL
ncbi:diphthamide synthesis protein [Candidatus Pacearchaeota archaeon]|nr:diphthamide synthesis protein [Candidatus Pacearchaeota archaeon]